ncbi:MAG: hypothetical protein DRP60_09625 [Spirochaetes bacterium]|nr:MAG: hypothetical protein DRP60_09625 [Spirochaetota bacterium]
MNFNAISSENSHKGLRYPVIIPGGIHETVFLSSILILQIESLHDNLSECAPLVLPDSADIAYSAPAPGSSPHVDTGKS